jgi:hypothetical protein
MKISLKDITIRELTANYVDNADEGVLGYNNRLNIRPPYQREFVYNDKQRNAVINSIINGFPLNTMYWSVNNQNTPDDETDDTYEVIDGQQRTVSICQYVDDQFSMPLLDDKNPKYFHNLSIEEKNKILDYKLAVYFCEGTTDEKLAWFNVINTVGEKLTDQELRNAVYSGSFVTNAKEFFSNPTAGGPKLSKDYVSGNAIRQEVLEKALKWISKGDPAKYMAEHQHDEDAESLKRYFTLMMGWIKATFTNTRREMKSVDWGTLYDNYKDAELNPKELEKQIADLMMDDDVTKKAGIYDYVLTGNQRKLSIRTFTPKQKREAYERQAGVCPVCGKHFELKEMEADHITPWSKGGKTISENCQMLCMADNRIKSGK